MIRIALLLAVLGLLPASATAQDRAATLADIRQQITVLSVEIQSLRRELSTTASAMGGTSGGTSLERLDAIEA